MGQAQIKQMRREERQDALDAAQAELLRNPELVHVTIGGVSRPFLLAVEGFELADARGHDPMPALGEIAASIFSDGAVAKVDADDPEAVQEAMREAMKKNGMARIMTTKNLVALVPALYAGFVVFDRTLRFEAFKASLTIPALTGVMFKVMPQLVKALSDMVGNTGPAVPAEADGDSGN